MKQFSIETEWIIYILFLILIIVELRKISFYYQLFEIRSNSPILNYLSLILIYEIENY